jgi:hypothetical protein
MDRLERMSAPVSGFAMAVLLLAAAAGAQARSWGGDVYRAYLEARREARYRIRVHNRSGGRVGVVIAVDGRNIISGARSELARGEPMYILDPRESESCEGWRAGEQIGRIPERRPATVTRSYANNLTMLLLPACCATSIARNSWALIASPNSRPCA